MYLSWEEKRKTIYLIIFIIFILGFLLYLLYPFLIKEPTCFDQKKNGTEKGVDCGGDCNLICVGDYKNLEIKEVRAIKVSQNKYNIIALVENNNYKISPKHLEIIFDFYDDTGKKIKSMKLNTSGSTGPVSPVNLDDFEAQNIASVIAKVNDVQMYKSVGNYEVKLKKFNYEILDNKTNINVFYESPYKDDLNEPFDMMIVFYNSLNNIVGYKLVRIDRLEKEKTKELFISLPYKVEKDIAKVKLIPISYLYAN